VAVPSEQVTDPGKQSMRPPRWAYWLAGAAVACSGALLAYRLSADLPIADRGPYWLAGTAVIFLGLWILTKGTRAEQGDGDHGRG
jgi:hypothetical protein